MRLIRRTGRAASAVTRTSPDCGEASTTEASDTGACVASVDSRVPSSSTSPVGGLRNVISQISSAAALAGTDGCRLGCRETRTAVICPPRPPPSVHCSGVGFAGSDAYAHLLQRHAGRIAQVNAICLVQLPRLRRSGRFRSRGGPARSSRASTVTRRRSRPARAGRRLPRSRIQTGDSRP